MGIVMLMEKGAPALGALALFINAAACQAQTQPAEPTRKTVAVEVNPVSQCLVPLQEGDKDFGDFGGFRNTCNFAVGYTYCVQNPKDGSWSSFNPCQTGRPTGNVEDVGPYGITRAHLYGGTRAHWFACANSNGSGEGPAGIWGQVVFDGALLRGRCRFDKSETVAETAKPRPPAPAAANPLNPIRQAFETARRSGDYSEVERLLRAGADRGDRKAMSILATLYTSGEPGVPRNPNAALELYRRLTIGGNASDQLQYAFALQRAGNPAAGRAIIEQLAKQGNRDAIEQLGYLRRDEARGTPAPRAVAAQPAPAPATREVVWETCKPQIMEWLRISSDTSARTVEAWRPSFMMEKLESDYGSRGNAFLDQRIAQIRHYMNDPIMNDTAMTNAAYRKELCTFEVLRAQPRR